MVTATVASIPHAGRFSPFGLGGVAIDVALGRAPTDWAWPVAVNVGIVLTALAAGCLVIRRQDL